jgi:isochorismate hydrolase
LNIFTFNSLRWTRNCLLRNRSGFVLNVDIAEEAMSSSPTETLIFGGLHAETCLTFARVQALKDDYEGMFVADAVGKGSQSAHGTAIERMAHPGAVPNTALAVVTELVRDWTSPPADKVRAVIYWYFAEVPKVTTEVGV